MLKKEWMGEWYTKQVLKNRNMLLLCINTFWEEIKNVKLFYKKKKKNLRESDLDFFQSEIYIKTAVRIR